MLSCSDSSITWTRSGGLCRAWCVWWASLDDCSSEPLSGGCSSSTAQHGACLQRLGRMLGAVVNRVCWLHHNAYPPHTWPPCHPPLAPMFRFELSGEDMAALDGLECGLVTGWNPIRDDPV